MATDMGSAAPRVDHEKSALNGSAVGTLVSQHTEARIFDIRQSLQSTSLINEIIQGLEDRPNQSRQLPTLLLYDEVGLKLFEDITYLDEYYLTGEEIELLENNAKDIANTIPAHSIVLELGSGYVSLCRF